MTWTPGTKLGPYEILSTLGAGGMGEVHRARDTRLNRDVAIKAIPAALADQEQLRQRFEREALAISSLNHPHICALFDVGYVSARAEGETGEPARLHYLVMELLEGESLADRLQKGPLPIQDVLKYGRQIAQALDAAHRKGITHRDLKPGNIMLTRTGAKLLDFGLAKTAALGSSNATSEATPISVPRSAGSQMPTAFTPEARPLTTAGTILGTFQYMAPEQLEGSDADARTDIFALGVVLYEMATGTRAFRGASRTSLIAAIVSSQPALISTLAPMTPAGLDHLVQRCLAKDPDDRWQSAHDVAAELQWIGEAGSQIAVAVPATTRSGMRERLAWGLAAVLGVASLASGIGFLTSPAPTAPRVFRSSIAPPPNHALMPFDQAGLALSPEGGTLAFVATGPDGRKQIWLRNLGETNASPVPETTGAAYPFWSPDGRYIGFFADGKLKSIDLRGGSPRVLTDAPSGRGGSWSRDGVILFAPNITSPIHRVSSNGGESEHATRHDPETEVTHRWPVFLPDGRRFLYLSRARATGRREVGRLMLASLDSPETSLLIDDSTNALYVEPGYLIYGRSSSLYAWRFDMSTSKLEGQAVPLVKEKLSHWEAKNFIPFAASDEGMLLYLPDASQTTEMRWYDREGRPLGALGPDGYDTNPRISPDGKRVAYIHGDSAQPPVDIWVRDLEFDRAFRLTQQSGVYADPAWAPDSDRIAFLCQPKGVADLCVTSVSGGGEMRLLYESSTWKGTGTWMPDGKRLLLSIQDPKTDQDIMILPIGGGEPSDVLRTPFAEQNPRATRDSGLMAYVSNQSGRNEVYVRGLGGAAGQWQISTGGGLVPRWRADGHELVYAAPDGNLMSVPIQAGIAFRPGTPVRLFSMLEGSDTQSSVFEDMTPDGQRFLLNVPRTSRSSVGFHAITNWTRLLGPVP